uniref:CAP domain-containing protein n=1 Tax=Ureibacillus sp. FSL W7-1570 TaxID=2954593 RepID=UPI00406CA0B7
MMKKWFMTFCALCLFATVVPQASATTISKENTGQPPGTIQIIKFENHNGIIVKKIERWALGNDELLKDMTQAAELAKKTVNSIVSDPFKAFKQPTATQEEEKTAVKVPANSIADNSSGQTNASQHAAKDETESGKGTNNGTSKQINHYFKGNPSSPSKGGEQAAPAVPSTQNAEPQSENPATKEKPSTSVTNQVSEFERQVVELTNAERAKAGLKPLTMYNPLMAVAKAKSQDMANLGYFSHTSPTYGSPFDQMRAAGIQYRAAGENIAQGQRTPEQVVNAWMNSPGHRANILNANYTHIGVGFVENGYYWTQQFIQM